MSTLTIKALLVCLCLSVISCGALAAQIPGNDEVLIASSLVAESQTPAPGTRTTLAVVMEPQGEWHGYWKQPGDVGLPPNLSWRLPAGVSVGPAEYPLPQTLLIDGLMNHVYEHPYALLLSLQLSADIPVGSQLPIQLDMQYLACRFDACVPERASLHTTLTVGDGASNAAVEQRFAQWRQAMPRPLGSTASFSVDNGVLRLLVPLPATMEINQPHLFAMSKGVINNAAEQRFERQGDVLVIETEVGDKPADSFSATLALGDGLGLDLQAVPTRAQAATTLSVTLVALAGAILGGLLLNLMPCVFPILSLKALSIARSSSHAGNARSEAVAYSLGVIVVCLLLGGILLTLRAGGTQVGWAFQLQDPRMIFVLLLLTCAIAFNLTGLFELSGLNAGSGLAERKGAGGAFWTGALAAFVATPCTGPFMAAAIGAALVLPPAAALLVFSGLGLGIALPFLLLGFIPALQRCLPKPGPWMQTLRNLLAVPMFLTALALLWVLGQQVASSTLVTIIGCAMLFALGLWATGLRQRVFKRLAWMPAVLAGLLALGLGLNQAHQQPATTVQNEPLAFAPAKLASLREAGDPVFLYFTADWCVTCKVNEQVAIDRDETREALAKAGVVSMRGDWTNGDAEITAFLELHGRSGVPLYLWYAQDQSEPKVLPQVLTPGVLIEQLTD